MSSKNGKSAVRSAAWGISIWAMLAFTLGSIVVFIVLDRFVANDIERRTDAWLSGEVEVLGDVAERTPNDALYNRVVSEVAELASREVPNKAASQSAQNNSVFFIQTGKDGALKLWVGVGDGQEHLKAIQARPFVTGKPFSIRVRGYANPFRVATDTVNDGGRVYLGVSERDQQRVLLKLRARFFVLWLSLVFLGSAIVFFTAWRTLSHVRRMTEAASQIGRSDLKRRVPTTHRNDEIAQLAHTLNGMLDRIESSVHQLHTITDSLAHDLRSPLTAIRGKLETSLALLRDGDQAEPIVSAIDELDRLTDFLNKSLDVAEAKADALRLTVSTIDLDELLQSMIDLYEPSLAEKDIRVHLHSPGPLHIAGDEGLIHRMVANLFDNELKHLPQGCTVDIQLQRESGQAHLLLRDNGPGFDPEVRAHLFTKPVKGRRSRGHGLGLAFVDAVVRAHNGAIVAGATADGGAALDIALPLAPQEPPNGRVMPAVVLNSDIGGGI
ncbi:MAG: ATP-binding protein [Acidobacteriota bacterium]